MEELQELEMKGIDGRHLRGGIVEEKFSRV